MNSRRVDPAVKSMLDEANRLPDSVIRNSMLERAACAAEACLDLDTAWQARCSILRSSSSHEDPRFETLFMSLAWCLAMSDRDPVRFSPSQLLWQYKWVVDASPKYARVPKEVLRRLIDDMDARFVREGWGRRAVLHKRVQLLHALGELEKACELVEEWRAIPRDRGADCIACEVNGMAALWADCGNSKAAIREARPIVLGRLTCATVPHSTFGLLLQSLLMMGEHATARDLYEKGRRLVAAMGDGGVQFVAPYFAGAAFFRDVGQVSAILRTRLHEAMALQSDCDRMRWFGHAAVGLEMLAESGVDELEVPQVPSLAFHGSVVSPRELAGVFRSLALGPAQALDARNGNSWNVHWLETFGQHWFAARR